MSGDIDNGALHAKIKASRHYFDAMTLLKQIGAEPK